MMISFPYLVGLCWACTLWGYFVGLVARVSEAICDRIILWGYDL